MINPINVEDVAPMAGAMCLVLRMSQALGVAPVRFQRSYNGWRVNVSRKMYKLHVFIVALINISGLTSFIIDTTTVDDWIHFRTIMMRVVKTTEISYSLLVVIIAAYGGHSRLREIIKCFKHLKKIKYTLGVGMNNLSEERRNIAMFIFALFVKLVLFCVDCFLFLENSHEKEMNTAQPILFSTCEFSLITTILLEAQFVFSALEIYSVLRSLNKVLKNVGLSSKMRGFQSTGHLSKHVPEAIQQLAVMYDEVCNQILKLGQAFNISLTVLLGIYIFVLVNTAYTLIQNVVNNKPLWFTNLMLWGLLQLIGLLFLVEPPHLTQIEMDRTNFLISRLENKFVDVEVSYELAKFSSYVALNKVCYSPLGVCKLSRSLLYSFLGMYTTYIIIMIQFQSYRTLN